MTSSSTRLLLTCLASIMLNNLLYALDEKPTSEETLPAKVTETERQIAEPLSGIIHFLKGDSITGQISHWNKDQITIKNQYLLDPVTFSTSNILTVTLDENPNGSNGVALTGDETTLVINSRDNQKGLHGVIKGSFSNIDEKHVTLNTSYAGAIKVLKKFVIKMKIDSKKGYLYLGPKSLVEWHNNSITPAWEYTNNSLIGGSRSGHISQDLSIPEEAAISFDLSWKDSEYISLYLFSSDHEQSKPANFYQLNLQRNKCSLTKYVNSKKKFDIKSQRDLLRDNRSRIPPRITRKLHAHYDIYMSKTKGEFHIYRNGVKLDTFTDSAPQASKFGTALHFISSSKKPIRIKNLSLSKWSGYIPNTIDSETFAKVKGEGERILLKNGDILLGQIGKVRDGLMQIETLYAPLNIPIVRMRSIDLTGAKIKEEPIMYENDIKCWFKDEGWIILKPISIEGNILTAYHQALGENDFDINIFKRIDLNIYNSEANANRKSNSW